MSLSRKGIPHFKKLLINKWKRLLYPFCIALIYVVLIKFSVGFWDGSTSVSRDILLGQVLMINAYGSYLWFLYALFWIFILAYVLEQLNWRERLYVYLPFLFCVSIVGSLMVRNHIFLGIQEALRYVFWFVLGSIFELNRQKIAPYIAGLRKFEVVILTFITILFYLVYLYVTDSYYIVGVWIILYINAFLGIALLYIVSIKYLVNYMNKELIAFLASIGLSLYIFSDPINYIIILLLRDFDMTCLLGSNIGAFMLFIFRFLVTFSGAILVNSLLKAMRVNIN